MYGINYDTCIWDCKGETRSLKAGADPGFWKGEGPTLEGFEMSRRNRRGDPEGDAGEEGETRLNPISLGGLGVSLRKFSLFGCFLLQSRHSSALYVQAY